MSNLIKEALSKEELRAFNERVVNDPTNPIHSLIGQSIEVILGKERRHGDIYGGDNREQFFGGIILKRAFVGKTSGKLCFECETKTDMTSYGLRKKFFVYLESFCDDPNKQHSTRYMYYDSITKIIGTIMGYREKQHAAEVRDSYIRDKAAASRRVTAKMDWEEKVTSAKTSMVAHFGEYGDDFAAWVPEAVTRIELIMPELDGAGKEWLSGKLMDWGTSYEPREADQGGISAEASLNAKAVEALQEDKPEVYEKLTTGIVDKYKPKAPDTTFKSMEDDKTETYQDNALIKNGNSGFLSGVGPVCGLIDKGVLDLDKYIKG